MRKEAERRAVGLQEVSAGASFGEILKQQWEEKQGTQTSRDKR